MELLKDIFGFMVDRKKYWLIPLILVFLLIGLLVVFGGGSAISPFVYTLF